MNRERQEEAEAYRTFRRGYTVVSVVVIVVTVVLMAISLVFGG